MPPPLRNIEESPWPNHEEMLRDFGDAVDEMPTHSRLEQFPKVRPSRRRRAVSEECSRTEPATPLDAP